MLGLMPLSSSLFGSALWVGPSPNITIEKVATFIIQGFSVLSHQTLVFLNPLKIFTARYVVMWDSKSFAWVVFSLFFMVIFSGRSSCLCHVSFLPQCLTL